MKEKTRPQWFSLQSKEYCLFGGSVLLKAGNSPTHRKFAQYAGYLTNFQKSDIVMYYFAEPQYLWAKMFLESEATHTEKKISIEDFRKMSEREKF